MAFALAAGTPVWATDETYTELKNQPVGHARLRWLAFDVYDATLYAPGQVFTGANTYLLELKYLRALSGEQVAAKGISEMKRMGFTDKTKLNAWEPQMVRMFADIEKGTRLGALRNPDGSTTFYRNGSTTVGTIEDPAFAEAFFGIWLAKNTTRPDLRRKLLGGTV